MLYILFSYAQVQSHSTVRVKNRKSQFIKRDQRRRIVETEDAQTFLHWVKNEFEVVTSYSELSGHKFLFYVGMGQPLYLYRSISLDFLHCSTE